ncbi:MAG: site-2 protease family protein [Verrucomicrobiota bacterium]|nr:site-2 protease family protein [Verrucomicrobiota bacterium]
MAFTFISAILAILGLGFLIFIHELGHYIVARRQGMKVLVFAIGFGKPLYSWMQGGVKWQICWLPFGGYVKIAGMQKEGNQEPSEIKDGFYGKTPWQRIKVALAGPLVNIAFAFVAFSLLWASGGREKNFAEFTHFIGWVDPQSPLYEKGVRPGDYIEKYDGRPFTGFKDLLIASVMSGKETEISGYKIDEMNGEKIPFQYTLSTYQDPRIQNDKRLTIGVLSPARYLIASTPLPAQSPMQESGVQNGDRVLWVDGELVYSVPQLSSLISQSTAFLTIKRGDEIFQAKIPRVQLDDLKLTAYEKGEIDDWQHEAGLKGRLSELFFIPYTLSPSGKVEGRLEFIDEQEQTKAFQACERCAFFNPLQEGDQILAIDGSRISNAADLLQHLQARRVLLIVERESDLSKPVPWKQADAEFERFDRDALHAIVSSIGTETPISAAANLHLLQPVIPKPASDFAPPNPVTDAQPVPEAVQKKLLLGIPLGEREVIYNPNPVQQLKEGIVDTWRTFSGLFSGSLNPKVVSGPVGIVHVVQQSWSDGAREAIFWLAVISLNLGLVNLLPIPVLDGGHILFSLVESITKRPIKAKTMERLIIPFVGLLIAFFLFVTYQDIHRLFF